jgi:DNA invertase Pin-like site-specific DNA recombinase
MAGEHAQQRRAVAYVRESTEEQGRGYSPDGRRQAIARYAEDHAFELVDEYLDFETGRAADKRPGFQRLIEDAMAGEFEAVLVFHTSRFARDTIEAKRYKKLLRSELGVEVISVTSAPTSTTPPRSSRSQFTRSSTSTTPSRSRSGPRWACARRHGKG